MNAISHSPGPRALVVAGALAAALAGCGSADYANRKRPPAPITVTAFVTGRKVALSPTKVGAGTVQLVISNGSPDSLDVRVEPEDAAGQGASSGLINPQGTATVSFAARQGAYRVSARGKAAVLRVGPRRPSAQNDVLLP